MNASERQTILLAAAGKFLAGGGLGLFVLPPELNLVIARGEGSRVWDVAGREYLDYHLSSGPALLGHAHPAITEAVARQLPKGTTYYFLNEPEIVLAERLVDAIACADVVHYTGSGTEATFYALRMIERHAHELAAVIVEPLQRVLLPEPGFLEAIREVTRRHGIVLVFDEIVTGFRIAWGGAQEKYGVVPDVACYGKAVSGGFPLAAIAGRANVMSTTVSRASARGFAPASSNPVRGVASPCRRRAKTPFSACASPPDARCAHGWISPPPTRIWATAGRSSS